MRVLALILALMAGQAQALSCMRPDLAVTWWEITHAPESYKVLHGTLTFDAGLMPVFDGQSPPPPPGPGPVPAQFSGTHLAGDGTFSGQMERAVVLQPTCAGPWCGGLSRSPMQVLAFAEVQGDALVINLSACGGHVFTDPTPEMLALVGACQRGETCRFR